MFELFLAGQLKFCWCFPFPFPRKMGGLGVWALIHAQAAASLLISLHLQPGAAAIIRNWGRGKEASSSKAWEVRTVPISKLNKKQQWKFYWTEWNCVLSCFPINQMIIKGTLCSIPGGSTFPDIKDDTPGNKCGKNHPLRFFSRVI